MSTAPYELYPEESACVQVKAVQGLILYRIVFNVSRIGKRSLHHVAPVLCCIFNIMHFGMGAPLNNAAPPQQSAPDRRSVPLFNVVTPLVKVKGKMYFGHKISYRTPYLFNIIEGLYEVFTCAASIVYMRHLKSRLI